jgi:DNA-binding GntR family transcriptional regulator
VLPYSRTKLQGVKNSSRAIFDQHVAILAAVEKRDPDAARAAMLEHIEWLESTLKKILE